MDTAIESQKKIFRAKYHKAPALPRVGAFDIVGVECFATKIGSNAFINLMLDQGFCVQREKVSFRGREQYRVQVLEYNK